MSLGAGTIRCSGEVITREEGIHGNPVSNNQQRHLITLMQSVEYLSTSHLPELVVRVGKSFHYNKQKGRALGQETKNTKHQ